ncbi:hypothetical protein Q9L58_009380 [Maublancomyces gigas]|uniref:C2H2-type domain-containing protein n=1 Tax=Discina gigas TaxID=1032678 RepID=A0ABR3G847_9PEZI
MDQHYSLMHPPAAAVPSQARAVVRAARCRLCHLKFFTKGSMDEHYAAMHPTPPETPLPLEPTPCGKCHILFYSQGSMDQHCSTMHPALPDTLPLEPTTCGKCHILFYTQESMDQHCATMHPTPRFARVGQFGCTPCSKRFINQYALDQHMVSAAHPEYVLKGHRRPLFKCEECTRTFEVKDLLILHAASHVQQRLGR